MTKPTHIELTNGAGRGVLVQHELPMDQEFYRMLSQMDGVSRWAYCIWKVEGDLDPSNPKTWEAGEDTYLQCAGSADAMTLEVRFIEDDVPHQFTIGKQAEMFGEPTEKVSFNNGKYSVKLYPNEVFTAKEAAQLFYDYYATGVIDGPYIAREITI